MPERSNPVDRLLLVLDQGLRTCFGSSAPSRPSPAAGLASPALEPRDARRSIALMRVNHAGEVAAQALYAGQSLLARTAQTRGHLEHAAREEHDHLAWCRARLDELGGRTSLLVPVWFAGGVAAGMAAAAAGDRNSFGFVRETEKQVESHLDDHLTRLPVEDTISRAILEQMQRDEIRHGEDAEAAGAAELSEPFRCLMAAGGGILRAIALFL